MKKTCISLMVLASVMISFGGCSFPVIRDIFGTNKRKWSGTITQCENHCDKVDGVHVRLLSGENKGKVIVFPVEPQDKTESFKFTINSADVMKKFGVETLTDADSLEITFFRRFNAKLTVKGSGAGSSDTTVSIDASVLDSINCPGVEAKFSELLGSSQLSYVRTWEQLSANGLSVSSQISRNDILLQLDYQFLDHATNCIERCIPTLDPDSAT